MADGKCRAYFIANWTYSVSNTAMQSRLNLFFLFLLISFASGAAPNLLTEEDKAGGWKLLFDGKTTAGWRSFKKPSFPAHGWVVEDGWFHCLGKEGGDII